MSMFFGNDDVDKKSLNEEEVDAIERDLRMDSSMIMSSFRDFHAEAEEILRERKG